MDFKLTREQELVRKTVRDFTENEVKPIAAETDLTCEYPRANIEKLFDMGVMGMIVPKQYGGAGADDLCGSLAIEELSKQCASTGDIVATHNGLCCGPIIQHGTEEQKEKYLRMLTEGHKVGAFALTEPDAGSDASKGKCTAILEGDHYVLNGSKIFITNGYVAEVFVVFAMTNPALGTKGISAFIVESSFPGFSVGKHEKKMGLHGSPTAEIVFTDCIVPKENLLGKEGKGFAIARPWTAGVSALLRRRSASQRAQ
jgi:butyryl-CoA dehydrogenase